MDARTRPWIISRKFVVSLSMTSMKSRARVLSACSGACTAYESKVEDVDECWGRTFTHMDTDNSSDGKSDTVADATCPLPASASTPVAAPRLVS